MNTCLSLYPASQKWAEMTSVWPCAQARKRRLSQWLPQIPVTPLSTELPRGLGAASIKQRAPARPSHIFRPVCRVGEVPVCGHAGSTGGGRRLPRCKMEGGELPAAVVNACAMCSLSLPSALLFFPFVFPLCEVRRSFEHTRNVRWWG